MRISVDGGALCGEKSGNYTFTKNFLKATSLYDKDNKYFIYTFCERNFVNSENLVYQKLLPKIGWSKLRLSFEEIANKKDVFLAVNQTMPIFKPNKIISFCHGLSYYFYPQYYPKIYSKLSGQLKEMAKFSDFIIVSSVKVKKELLKIYPTLKNIIVLPFGIPYDVLINQTRSNIGMVQGTKKFFLSIGEKQEIKNTKFIVESFNKLKKEKKYQNYKLYLVGRNKITRKELLDLYRRAGAYLTASYYESFNFPALEALVSGCPVVGLRSAIIPEMEKYVNICDNNIEEFVAKIKRAVKEKNEINQKEINEIFCWKKYVKKLVKLYALD